MTPSPRDEHRIRQRIRQRGSPHTSIDGMEKSLENALHAETDLESSCSEPSTASHAEIQAEPHTESLPPADPLAQLAFIRSTMENAAVFTSVPGRGQIAVGCTALAAAYIAAQIPFAQDPQRWLLIWMFEAVLATSISAFTMQRKAARAGQSLMSGPGKKVLMNLMPAMFAGALLTLVMHMAGADRAVPPMWFLLYGTAVISGGAFSVSIVPVMGLSFLAFGSVIAFTPLAWVDWEMALGFGVMHIVYGAVIARKHGG